MTAVFAAAWTLMIIGSAIAANISTIGVPVLVAIIMAGPSWFGINRGRKEVVTQLADLDAKLDRHIEAHAHNQA